MLKLQPAMSVLAAKALPAAKLFPATKVESTEKSEVNHREQILSANLSITIASIVHVLQLLPFCIAVHGPCP